MSVRDQLVSLLTPQLPAGWRLVKYQRNLDTIDAVTVMFKQATIKNTPEAPRGTYTYGYVITLIDPATDPERAEVSLDDNVETLWKVLESSSSLHPTLATKAKFSDTNLCYDIDLEILARKDT